jgi:hypothetical protein
MENEQITPDEGLKLIQQTIQRARGKFSDISIYFIFWGWLVLTAGLLNYILHLLNFRELAEWGWFLMPLGGIVMLFWIVKKKEQAKQVTSFIDKYLIGLWTGFFIALAITLYVILGVDESIGYFMLILCMSWATLTTGYIIDFSVMRWSGLAGFGLAMVSLFVHFPEKQLVLASAMLIIYIIPGHLLRNFVKKQNTDS